MRYLKQFESVERYIEFFRGLDPVYRKLIMDKLEDSLIEIFDKWSLSEGVKSRVYSWWRGSGLYSHQIVIGNIPNESQMYLILDDVFSIKSLIEKRIGRGIGITNGNNQNGTCWILIEPK
jgi:hypothetical protein